MSAAGRHRAVRGFRWFAVATLLAVAVAAPGTAVGAASGNAAKQTAARLMPSTGLPASAPSVASAASRLSAASGLSSPTAASGSSGASGLPNPSGPSGPSTPSSPSGPLGLSGEGAARRLAGIVAARTTEVARAAARVAALSTALTGLRTQAEILSEHYDQEVLLQQQDSAAYQAALNRATVARQTERTDRLRLAQQAAADYEADGGPDMAVAMVAGVVGPEPYLSTLGVQQVLDSQRADLLAASAAGKIVTGLFARQAATALAQQRTASRTAGNLKQAVAAAVTRQTGVIKAATAARAQLAAALTAARSAAARATAAETTGKTAPRVSPQPPAGLLEFTASVRAGGPPGAAPGVTAPDWSADAGATTQQGTAAANWALTQVGKPYQWGGAGPSAYDCSGLAMDAWARAGVALLHWTGYQWVSGPHVPLSQLRPGDLVFYATNSADPATIHHVGIYLGDDLMVDAPYTGASVRIDSIDAYPGLIGTTRPATPPQANTSPATPRGLTPGPATPRRGWHQPRPRRQPPARPGVTARGQLAGPLLT